jgi:hypothetical protein
MQSPPSRDQSGRRTSGRTARRGVPGLLPGGGSSILPASIKTRAFAPGQPAFPGKVVRTGKVRMRPAGNEAGELSEPSGASCDGGFFRFRHPPPAPRLVATGVRGASPAGRRCVLSEVQSGIALRVAVEPAVVETGPDGIETAADALLGRLVACGTKSAPGDATGRVLCEYWAWLRRGDRERRHVLVERLRRAIEQGRCGLRAWVPVILGETDFDLVRAAVRSYVYARPASLERLEQRIVDSVDWIRRGLALNRAAIFAAVLERADDDVLARLAGLRSALTDAEARAVCNACAGVRDEATREFLDDWRAIIG